MSAPALKIKKSVREQVSKEEWDTRVNLAACYRLMAEFGMVEMIANHLSARVQGRENEFLINPYGMLYDEMTASSMVLRNHGLLTCGATVAESFNNMYRLERACQLQVTTLSCNTEIRLPPAEVVRHTNDLFRTGARRRFGLLEWPAMLRKLDRIDPSYRD